MIEPCAYHSINRYLTLVWEGIRTDLPILIVDDWKQHKTITAPEYLSVYWMNQETIQTDIILSKYRQDADRKSVLLDLNEWSIRLGLGPCPAPEVAYVPRFDYSEEPPKYLNTMELRPLDAGWIQVRWDKHSRRYTRRYDLIIFPTVELSNDNGTVVNE